MGPSRYHVIKGNGVGIRKQQRPTRKRTKKDSEKQGKYSARQENDQTQPQVEGELNNVISVDPHWRNPIGEWLPNSPDLNPLDYAVWSILEQKACAKPHSNVESLKRALKKAWNEITLDTLVKIVDNFPKRLKACVDAKGGHFE
uniref:Transposase n=1 Tax=Acrobeloides nanus TaxID=290746 RepID=A0A914E5S4_9BILA